MCTHEEKHTASPASDPIHPSAWDALDGQTGGPIDRLYNLESMLACIRLSIQGIMDDDCNSDLCNLHRMVEMAEQELGKSMLLLEDALSDVPV